LILILQIVVIPHHDSPKTRTKSQEWIEKLIQWWIKQEQKRIKEEKRRKINEDEHEQINNCSIFMQRK